MRALESAHSTLNPQLSNQKLCLPKKSNPARSVNYNEAPHMIEGMTVQSPSARGSATFYKFRARNLVTKQKTDITLKGTDGLDDADFHPRSDVHVRRHRGGPFSG